MASYKPTGKRNYSLSVAAWGMLTPQQEALLIAAPWSPAKGELVEILGRVSGHIPSPGYCGGRALLECQWELLAASLAISKYFRGLKKAQAH